MFRLGKRSRGRLKGVKPALVAVVERAIEITTTDFAVGEGLRSLARQRELFDAGASQTMKSRHLTGDAVDLWAMVGSEVRWEFALYLEVAYAMARAAAEQCAIVEWGACWQPITGRSPQQLESMVAAYVARCKREKRKPLVDGPHFQLVR